MRFERLYSIEGRSVREQIEWDVRDALIPGGYEQRGIEVPAAWSQNAINILAKNYFRKAGVPSDTYEISDHSMPSWLRGRKQYGKRASTVPLVGVDPSPNVSYGGETSAHQVFHRLAGCWTYWGWRGGVLTEEDQARIFYAELYLMMARQIAMPNSPQFFNTGLHWAYGIEGDANGQWATDEAGAPYLTTNAYERPQTYACFLASVTDDLVNEGGIMDLWVREARIFKHGSGSGVNISPLRGKGEPLSGGGVASGALSFAEVGDRSAGAIQSGGTTRRAAKMVCLNVDHPETPEFIELKVREEAKAAAIAVGSRIIRDHALQIAAATGEDSVIAAREAGIPEAVIDRARIGIVPNDLPIGPESEAIRTIFGQNANNSIRVTDEFFAAVDADAEWNLLNRVDGTVARTVRAKELFDQICRAAWACADPGLLFHDTINAWNTCAADGTINTTNPCAEFHHLDGSACLLASLRLTAFLHDEDAPRTVSALDYKAFEHATRFWTVVLDISVTMASFPAKEFAIGAHLYRTLGLGYMDLGGLLMRLAVPYDSPGGRALAAGLTALMTGVAYRTSAELAEELGPFPRWEENALDMRRVLRNHVRATCADADWENLNVTPQSLDAWRLEDELRRRIDEAWAIVLNARQFRNAQVTLLAPTGTISFVADCDTTGVEPDFSLIKYKTLAGGGTMNIVNQAVPTALRRLGLDEDSIAALCARVEKTGSLEGAPLNEAQLAVFDCANPTHAGGRSIAPMGHVRMVAAVQPFLSGGVSKTINLPRNARVEDVTLVYREAHRLGLKAVAVYRDGSKLTQPLSAAAPTVSVHEMRAAAEYFADVSPGVRILIGAPSRGVREYPPWRRENGFTQKVKIGPQGQSLFLHVGEYPDGRPCEVFLELSHEGSTMRAFAGLLGMAVSVGLQYGVPVSEFVERFRETRFEPAGFVEGHERIKSVSSIGDYLGRELALTYLGDDSAAQVTASKASTFEDVMTTMSTTTNVTSHYARYKYSGELCSKCGSDRMRRAGTCLTCEACGETTGCG